MDLKEKLPVKLYSELKRNNLLQFVKAITNEKNFISVDLYDIEVFNKNKYLGRIDYTNKEEVPEVNNDANSLLVCFSYNGSISLGNISDEVDKLSDVFNTKEIVFGTRFDESLDSGTIKITCLMFETLDLKKLFDEQFYNDLKKCNFVKDIEEMLSYDGLINIDEEDFVNAAKGEVVGAISQVFDNLDEKYVVKKISNKIPTDCIFNITSGTDIKLTEVDILMDKLRKLYPDILIIFGTTIIEEMESQIKVQALLAYAE